jgi:hypothetical protein
MPHSPSSSSEASASPSPVRRRRVVKSKKVVQKAKRKPTHWLVLVRSIYGVNGPKGSSGLTAAMKVGRLHLQDFKAAFADVPSDVDATEWVRERLKVVKEIDKAV